MLPRRLRQSIPGMKGQRATRQRGTLPVYAGIYSRAFPKTAGKEAPGQIAAIHLRWLRHPLPTEVREAALYERRRGARREGSAGWFDADDRAA